MPLIAQIESAQGANDWADANNRFTNTVGTPIVSVEVIDESQLLAGVYNLTFDNVVAETDADVTVVADSPNNPNNTGGSPVTVALDGATGETQVIRGLAITFDDNTAFDDTWTAIIRVGLDRGTLPAFGPAAGQATAPRRIRVKNDATEPATLCKARCLPNVKQWKKTGSIFADAQTFAENATEKITGGAVEAYAITVANVTGSGSGKTFDLLVDGAPVNVINLTDQSESNSLGLGVVDWYRIIDGDLEDVEFLLDENCASPDEANLFVFSVRFVQIAIDVNNTPGSFGTADVVLTEPGQAAGVIRANQFAYFWRREVVTNLAPTASNPYPIDTALDGAMSVAVDWSG